VVIKAMNTKKPVSKAIGKRKLKTLKKVKELCKEFGFTAGMLKGEKK